MRFLRGLLAFVLVFVIVGGIGYIAYTTYFVPMNNAGNNAPMTGHGGMGNTTGGQAAPNDNNITAYSE